MPTPTATADEDDTPAHGKGHVGSSFAGEVEEEITVRYGPALSDEGSSARGDDGEEVAEDLPDVPESPYVGDRGIERVQSSDWNLSPAPSGLCSVDYCRSSGSSNGPSVAVEPAHAPSVFTDMNGAQAAVRVAGLIGEGRFGRVLLAMREDSGELLAVKEVSLHELGDDPEKKVQNLICEIQIMRPLNHPNIVRYFGTRLMGQTLSIFMEYVPGGSLASIIEKFGSLTEPLSRKYAQQIVRGLEYLHGQQIVHRDIKGANILIDHKGLLKLADFGCSRQLMDLLRASQYTLTGTPHWMAPEVIRQTGHGTPADIWSLGSTVIEMVTGKPPFIHLGTNYAVMYAVGTGTGDMDLPTGLSAAGEAFLRACLARDPAKRWTARQLADHPWLQTPQGAGSPPAMAAAPSHPAAPPKAVADVPARPYSDDAEALLEEPCPPPAPPDPPSAPRKVRPKPAQLGEIPPMGLLSPDNSPPFETSQSAPVSREDDDDSPTKEARSATVRQCKAIGEPRKASSAPPKASRRPLPSPEPRGPAGKPPPASSDFTSPTRSRNLSHSKQVRPPKERVPGAATPQHRQPPSLPTSLTGRTPLPPAPGPPTSSPGFVPLFSGTSAPPTRTNPTSFPPSSTSTSSGVSPTKRTVDRRVSFRKGGGGQQAHVMAKIDDAERPPKPASSPSAESGKPRIFRP